MQTSGHFVTCTCVSEDAEFPDVTIRYAKMTRQYLTPDLVFFFGQCDNCKTIYYAKMRRLYGG